MWYFSGCQSGWVLKLGGVIRSMDAPFMSFLDMCSQRGEGFALSAWECVLQHCLAGMAAEQSFPALWPFSTRCKLEHNRKLRPVLQIYVEQLPQGVGEELTEGTWNYKSTRHFEWNLSHIVVNPLKIHQERGAFLPFYKWWGWFPWKVCWHS